MKEKYRNLGRVFSKEFRLRQVELYDQGLVSIAEICREHDVSQSGVRKWLKKYSKHYKHRTRVVVEMESEERKNKDLLKRIAELERIIGRKQMKIDYMEKLMEVTSEQYGVDFEKKSELPPLNGSEKTEDHTTGK